MTATRDQIGLAFRKAMLQTDPEFDENNRAGAAFLAVLDEMQFGVIAGWDRWDWYDVAPKGLRFRPVYEDEDD